MSRPAPLQFLALLGILLLPVAAFAQAKPETDPEVVAVQKAGGKIERDDAAPDKPIVVVSLGVTQAADADLEHLKGFTKVKKLTLNGTKITDAGLDHIKGLASLEKLYLVDTKITDAGLEKLKDLKELKVLSLVGTQVTDAGMEHLKGLANLQTVFLHGTKVGDEAAKKLQEALPKLKIVR